MLIMKKLFLNILSLFILLLPMLGQGSAYCGPYTPSPPLSFSNIKDTVISGLEIKNNKGNCISLSNCSNITIKNCRLSNAKGEGVHLYKSHNITVVNCFIDSVATGVYAGACTEIKVLYNDFRNVFGPMPRGQMVQFAEVSGTGNLIHYNAMENITGQSYPEDAISLFKSHGNDKNPITIIGNWIRGGGPSTSGGGIMTGDMGGSYILVQDNILVNPGQYGITIASGHHISIVKNLIFAKQKEFNSVGLSAYKQYPIDSYSDTIMFNQVNYRYKDGTLNNFINDASFGTVFGWSTNFYNPILDATILPEKIIGRCKENKFYNSKNK